jgi:hypothetical protein
VSHAHAALPLLDPPLFGVSLPTLIYKTGRPRCAAVCLRARPHALQGHRGPAPHSSPTIAALGADAPINAPSVPLTPVGGVWACVAAGATAPSTAAAADGADARTPGHSGSAVHPQLVGVQVVAAQANAAALDARVHASRVLSTMLLKVGLASDTGHWHWRWRWRIKGTLAHRGHCCLITRRSASGTSPLTVRSDKMEGGRPLSRADSTTRTTVVFSLQDRVRQFLRPLAGCPCIPFSVCVCWGGGE